MLSRVSWTATYDGTYSVRRLPVRDPSEPVNVLFDFTASANSVSGPSLGVFVDASPAGGSGTDLSVLDVRVSELNPAQVIARLSGGTPLNDYGLRCVVTADSGDSMVLTAILPVRALPGYAQRQTPFFDYSNAANSCYLTLHSVGGI